jgi:radical S-adenosyl methionine domain-containing protein 2
MDERETRMKNYPDVINFHFTDLCNYRCSYCFVNKKAQATLSWENIEVVLQNIKRYFQTNILGKGRVNLVGGEPMIYHRLQEMIDRINQMGMECSMVTNGSLLTKEFIEHNRSKLSMIGISVDSLNEATNRKIGRCDVTGKCISREEMTQRCQWVRESGIQLKINTVYSKLNQKENLRTFLQTVQPHRTKLFQMLIVKGVNDHSVQDVISELEFNKIGKKYQEFGVVVESNDLMTNSYVIVNAQGQLLDKEDGAERIVGSLLQEELKSLIDNSNILEEKYQKRYLSTHANESEIV